MKQARMRRKPIGNSEGDQQALKQAELALDAPREPGPDSDNRLQTEALLTSIEAYKRKHGPMDPPNPVAATRFRMEQGGLSVKNLARRRDSSLGRIRRRHKGLGIHAQVLIAPRKSGAAPGCWRDKASASVRQVPGGLGLAA